MGLSQTAFSSQPFKANRRPEYVRPTALVFSAYSVFAHPQQEPLIKLDVRDAG
jgi:hypothetical protein